MARADKGAVSKGTVWSPPFFTIGQSSLSSMEYGAYGSLPDSPLEGCGFELVWGFPCQVVFFGLSPVLCSEAEGAVLRPVAYDQVPGARAMGSRERNASKAWRFAA